MDNKVPANCCTFSHETSHFSTIWTVPLAYKLSRQYNNYWLHDKLSLSDPDNLSLIGNYQPIEQSPQQKAIKHRAFRVIINISHELYASPVDMTLFAQVCWAMIIRFYGQMSIISKHKVYSDCHKCTSWQLFVLVNFISCMSFILLETKMITLCTLT